MKKKDLLQEMPYLVSLDDVGLESANKAYGGFLNAYSFKDITFEKWFDDFRNLILSKIGVEYFPIYRMADGEYRFLMGRKFNIHKKPLYREVLAILAEKLRLKNPDKWKTSWGEEYSALKMSDLRIKLIEDIENISKNGMLGCYLNENGLNAFTEYNPFIFNFFKEYRISFNQKNYIPFHFICGLLVLKGWEEFYIDRNILIITGSDDRMEAEIAKTIKELGAKSVSFIRISKTSSMEETINLESIHMDADIVFVAAGIGSANILNQLKPLKTLVIDIGGFMNCFVNKESTQHGGIFKLPI